MAPKRLLIATVLACPLASVGHAPAALAQDAQFRLSLAWTVEEIEPDVRSRLQGGTFLVTLGKGGKVTEQFTRSHGRRAKRSRFREGELGDDMDGRFVARWKVVNQNTLVRLLAMPSHTFAIWVKTDGGHACTVSLEWRLKPGQASYDGWLQRGDRMIRFKDPTVQQAQCEAL